MGHKETKVKLNKEEKYLLKKCVCGAKPTILLDPKKGIYKVTCSKEGCPGKASHVDKLKALELWKATVTIHNKKKKPEEV